MCFKYKIGGLFQKNFSLFSWPNTFMFNLLMKERFKVSLIHNMLKKFLIYSKHPNVREYYNFIMRFLWYRINIL